MNPNRLRQLNNNTHHDGPVVYWMSRDQRVHDNWAITYAQEYSQNSQQPLIIVFCLQQQFLQASQRNFAFMIEGLQLIATTLDKLHIPFYLLHGNPEQEIPIWLKQMNAGLLIIDMSPLKIGRQWRDTIAKQVHIPVIEIDAHNIIPVWITSQKKEYGAYTIRPKIHTLISEYLDPIPQVKKQTIPWNLSVPTIVWNDLIQKHNQNNSLTWITSGEQAARDALKHFIEAKIHTYNEQRNNPTTMGQSNLSPYLHFGQLSAHRIVHDILQSEQKHILQFIEKQKNGSVAKNGNIQAFLEELIVRKELSDNFCFYTPEYDQVTAFPSWAQQTLAEHVHDKREFVYTFEEFEHAHTHDNLWNAAQKQMVITGKMHGYMRMYWAKKILEWTKSPEEALAIAIQLNDTYSLDGRDPNGYAGIAWSIGGVHDRPWFDRPVYGKVRYMSYNGCKSKFNVELYIQQWI